MEREENGELRSEIIFRLPFSFSYRILSSCMIITRTPLRISFIGGGSDLPAFYERAVGRVVSTTINKYVFVAINKKFDDKFRVSYSVTEIVDRPSEIKNTRVRAALEHFKINRALEIVSLADAPAHGTGLGSSSSFLVGLIAGLSQFTGGHLHKDRFALAETACRLELDVLKESIGKQDQYAAAYGGFNLIEFYPDRVTIQPIAVARDRLAELNNHLMLLYTGVVRSTTNNSQTLTNNLRHDEKKFLIQQRLADLVVPFRDQLVKGDFQALGELLHEGWLLKKKTSDAISNSLIDEIYRVGRRSGAWGGKLLGAGAGGFILFLVPPERRERLAKNLSKFRQFPIDFDDHGSKVIFNRYEYQ